MPQLMPLYWNISVLFIMFFVFVMLKMYIMVNELMLELKYNIIMNENKSWMW